MSVQGIRKKIYKSTSCRAIAASFVDCPPETGVLGNNVPTKLDN